MGAGVCEYVRVCVCVHKTQQGRRWKKGSLRPHRRTGWDLTVTQENCVWGYPVRVSSGASPSDPRPHYPKGGGHDGPSPGECSNLETRDWGHLAKV